MNFSLVSYVFVEIFHELMLDCFVFHKNFATFLTKRFWVTVIVPSSLAAS